MKRTIVTLAMVLALAGPISSMSTTLQDSYSCVSMPAYTDYSNVQKVQCPVGANRRETPKVMGATGF